MRNPSRPIATALVAASLALPASAGDEGRRLSGAELRARIAGTTWYGMHTETGSPWFEYQAPDGNSVLVEVDGVYHGVWQVNGDIVCYCYEEFAGYNCFFVEERDGRLDVIETAEGAVSSRVTDVEPGNPHGLRPKDLFGKTSVCPGMV